MPVIVDLVLAEFCRRQILGATPILLLYYPFGIADIIAVQSYSATISTEVSRGFRGHGNMFIYIGLECHQILLACQAIKLMCIMLLHHIIMPIILNLISPRPTP